MSEQEALELQKAAKEAKPKRRYTVPDKAEWVRRSTQYKMDLHTATLARDKALEDAATLDAELKRIKSLWKHDVTWMGVSCAVSGGVIGCIVGWAVAHG